MTIPRRTTSSIVLVALAALLTGCGGTTTPTTPAVATNPTPSVAPTAAPSRAPTPIPIATATPLGDRLVAQITVAKSPCAMAVDATTVWVTGGATSPSDLPELDRIDPATNKVVDLITLEGAPCGVALGPDGRIWVAELVSGSVVAVDIAARKVTDRLDHVGPALWDLKAGLGSIWVVDRTAKAVLRIDPKTAKVKATIAVGPQPSGLAIMPGAVWVSDDVDGKVRRIDPATNTVVAMADIGGSPSWFADDGASNLVIAERGRGNVVALDLETGAQGTQTTGWDQPLDGTVFEGLAWVPEGSARRVGVLDLAEGGLTRYALPGAVNPFVAEPGFGDVWVLDYGGATIWRIRP